MEYPLVQQPQAEPADIKANELVCSAEISERAGG